MLDALALSRTDHRPLLMVRRLFDDMRGEAVLAAASALSHVCWVPDRMYSSRNWLAPEVKARVVRELGWSLDELRMLLTAVMDDADMFGRGVIGQTVSALILQDESAGTKLFAIARLKSADMTARRRAIVYLAYLAKDDEGARDIINRLLRLAPDLLEDDRGSGHSRARARVRLDQRVRLVWPPRRSVPGGQVGCFAIATAATARYKCAVTRRPGAAAAAVRRADPGHDHPTSLTSTSRTRAGPTSAPSWNARMTVPLPAASSTRWDPRERFTSYPNSRCSRLRSCRAFIALNPGARAIDPPNDANVSRAEASYSLGGALPAVIKMVDWRPRSAFDRAAAAFLHDTATGCGPTGSSS